MWSGKTWERTRCSRTLSFFHHSFFHHGDTEARRETGIVLIYYLIIINKQVKRRLTPLLSPPLLRNISLSFISVILLFQPMRGSIFQIYFIYREGEIQDLPRG